MGNADRFPRIVDQHVELAVPLQDGVDQAAYRRLVTKVGLAEPESA